MESIPVARNLVWLDPMIWVSKSYADRDVLQHHYDETDGVDRSSGCPSGNMTYPGSNFKGGWSFWGECSMPSNFDLETPGKGGVRLSLPITEAAEEVMESNLLKRTEF